MTFRGEDGIDAGGLTREWYSVLAKEIFNPNYALFTPAADGSTFQPNPMSEIAHDQGTVDSARWFQFVGRVVGKAIADGQLLDAHFTRSFYKHMLGVPVTVEDMGSMDPEYYKNLRAILQHPLADLGLDDLTFSAESQKFGLTETTNLIPDGDKVPVTDENKNEYVTLICRHRMTSGIRNQIHNFLQVRQTEPTSHCLPVRLG